METKFKPYKHLVLNIPHASNNILEELMQKNPPFRTKAAYRDYQKNSRPLIDWYTDELFSVDNDQRITPIVATICRTLCDVERMINDPLEAKGYGIVCTKMHHYTAFSITSSVMDFIPYRIPLYQYYLDYHYRLAKAILTNSHDFSYFHPCPVLLIDCHSFSSMPTALCDPGPAEEQVDICIGYNDDATCPPQEVIDFVAGYFEELGYRVGRNTPFSHSKTVECPVPYHSLMIEVNKRCYMNEQTLEKTEGFARLRQAIEGLYSQIL